MTPEQQSDLDNVIQSNRAVEDAHDTWLGVSQDEDDIDNDEYKAWQSAMMVLAAVASAYIDKWVHPYCLSPHLKPRDSQDNSAVFSHGA